MCLHVTLQRAGGGKPTLADSALEWFSGAVRFQVDFEVVAARKGGLALVAVVLFVSCVQFYVAVSTPLVLKEPAAVGALEGQFVAVDLLVPLQVAEATEGLVAELAGIWQAGSPFLLPDAELTPITDHLRG